MAVVINGTTGISGVDGSAGTPALQGTDTNTGITYPAANVIGFSADGVERLRVTTSGLQYNGSSSGSTVLQANATAGSGTLTLPTTTGTVLSTADSATLTKGFAVTPYNIGTITSGTVTPAPANGNYQYYTNNGAHTLAVPGSDCAIDILVTNGASAGAITLTAGAGNWVVGSSTGSAYATTNGNRYIFSIRRINSISTYFWYAMQ